MEFRFTSCCRCLSSASTHHAYYDVVVVICMYKNQSNSFEHHRDTACSVCISGICTLKFVKLRFSSYLIGVLTAKEGVFVCERDRSSLRRSWRVGISVETRSAVSPPTPSSFPSTPFIPAEDGIRYACVRTQKYTNHPTARRPMVCVIAYTLTCILTYRVCFFFER